MSVAIYVEGGGDSAQLRADCRQGFRKFFENVKLAGRMPRGRPERVAAASPYAKRLLDVVGELSAR